MFPTGLAFVATDLPATPRVPDYIPTTDIREKAVISGVPGYLFVPLRDVAVKQSTSFEIDIGAGVPTFCWYPISV
jgi:hypothetical protein